uniref:Uncharacterized protein n=1 Tax=Triticum urartu TaxID=4572 RepID=A0A8R7UW01_TRIUA
MPIEYQKLFLHLNFHPHHTKTTQHAHTEREIRQVLASAGRTYLRRRLRKRRTQHGRRSPPCRLPPMPKSQSRSRQTG